MSIWSSVRCANPLLIAANGEYGPDDSADQARHVIDIASSAMSDCIRLAIWPDPSDRRLLPKMDSELYLSEAEARTLAAMIDQALKRWPVTEKPSPDVA